MGTPFDILVEIVAEEWGPLIARCCLRSSVETARWGTTVTLEGEQGWLTFFYGEREFDFTAEFRFRQFPRKRPMPLWALLQAAGVDPEPLGPATRIDAPELRRQVAAAADLSGRYWPNLEAEPTEALLREASSILDRYTRSIR